MMKVLSFFTAKGGTGKTTFNIFFASYLKYVQEKRVMVLDLDAREYSLTCCRDRDIDYLNSNGLPCELDSFYPVEAVRDLSEQSIGREAQRKRVVIRPVRAHGDAPAAVKTAAALAASIIISFFIVLFFGFYPLL